MFKHDPSGHSPYHSSAYDRRPFFPTEGEQVFIRIVAEDSQVTDGGEPSLLLSDGDSSQRVLPVKDPKTAENCFLFRVGPFEAGQQIRYTFSNDATSEYHFSVRSRSRLKTCEKIIRDGNQLRLVCQLENNRLLRIGCRCDNDHFILDMSSDDTVKSDDGCDSLPFAKAGVLSENQATLSLPDKGKLHVTKEPFSISLITNEDKECLQIQAIDGEITFDTDGRPASFSFPIRIEGDAFYGCGEKFDRVNQKGLFPHNIVHETFTHQGHDTYLPTPWLFSEAGWGFFSESGAETYFDLRYSENGFTRFKYSGMVGTDGFSPIHLFLGKPQELIQSFVQLSGPAKLPPSWAFGPWISANGWATQAEAEEQLDQLKKLDIPASAIVLEAWSDECTFYIWNGAKYKSKSGGVFRAEDFTYPSDGPWPNPRQFADRIRDEGMHLLLWQIPVIPGPGNEERTQNRQLQLDLEEAVQNRYCVFKADGSPYYLPDLWFSGSLLLDFTNPAAVTWWLEKRRYLIEEFNVEGFKTDGGEFVYDPTLVFHNGKSGLEERNLYPARYTQAYYDFLETLPSGGVLFSRAGYTGSQSRPLHWSGDQFSSYSELRSQLISGLSAGLSGVLFWGFDIGGFTGELPSSELYLRSAAMAAFSPIMQFHSEPRSGQYEYTKRKDWINDRSPWNLARVNDDLSVIDHYRSLAKLRMKLLPYLYDEAKHSVESGRALMAHLVYDFPEDKHVLNIEDQYMLGRKLLVAPILEKNAHKRSLYLPAGEWFDFWSGQLISGCRCITVESPIGSIPVFSNDPEILADRL